MGHSMKALFLIADGFEDIQFFALYYRLQEEGFSVTVAAAIDNRVVTGLHGYTIEPDMPIPEVSPAEYAVLVIPGGRAPEKLRLREEAVDLTRTFMQDGSIIATVGHGAQLLISAGVIDNKSVACSNGIRDDVRVAGGSYRDDDVAIDGNLITCRGNNELPMFSHVLMQALNTRVSS
jgi:protease I